MRYGPINNQVSTEWGYGPINNQVSSINIMGYVPNNLESTEWGYGPINQVSTMWYGPIDNQV